MLFLYPECPILSNLVCLRTRHNKDRLNAQEVVLKQEKKINTQINHYVSGDRIKIFVFEQLLQEGSHRRSRELKS